MTKRWLLSVTIGLVLLPGAVAAIDQILLHALFKNKAIVVIDGTRRILATGQVSPEGIKLVGTDTEREEAQIEVGGKREVLKLGMVIAGFKPTGQPAAILWAEPNGHFRADGTINGVGVRFLLDTGATTIALSSQHANRIGIDYKKRGRPGYAQTASGVVRIYGLKLDTVQLGNITLHNLDAGVIEGAYPAEVLLGMSFLGQLDMKRDGAQLELTQR